MVKRYGTLWARNKDNTDRLKKFGEMTGVYVLCDGSMPVYIGRGIIWRRLRVHRKSRTKTQFWDYFSWYAIPKGSDAEEVEALLLRMLPYYLRLLNRRRGNFRNATRVAQVSHQPDPIKKPKYVRLMRRKH